MKLDDAAELRVLIEVPAKDGHPAFRDALYLGAGQWQRMTPNELEALKRARYQTWLDAINPPDDTPSSEPTPDTHVALQQAMDALDQARQVVSDVLAATIKAPDVEVAAETSG